MNAQYERVLTSTPASAIAIRAVRWLWHQRLALGTLSLCGGREGIGKSIVTTTLASMVTRGTLDGAHYGKPRGVIVIASEDSREHTIVPRLIANGADLTRVHFVEAIAPDGAIVAPVLPLDLVELKRVIRLTDAALVIIDPLLSRLDTNLDSHKDAEVRLALEPLSALADQTNTTILGLIHVSKSQSADPLTTLMASRAFVAVPRSVLFVMKDPDDESLRLLGLAKNNLGPIDLPTLAFRIHGVKVGETAEGDVWTGKLTWEGESDRTITEALEAASEAAGDKTATTEAGDWLADFLSAESDQRAEHAVIKREGGKAGHSIDALKRARKRLGITSQNGVGFPRKTYWHLPVSATSGRHTPTALTAPTALTGARETSLREVVGRQSVQSARSVQSVQSGEGIEPCTGCADPDCSWCDGPDREAL